jgi:hypothetical protein
MRAKIPCPVVYADGRECGGYVIGATAYGPRGEGGKVERAQAIIYRLWCSEKYDMSALPAD